jgi:hypothetical protein
VAHQIGYHLWINPKFTRLPDLVVIYLGMRVNTFQAFATLRSDTARIVGYYTGNRAGFASTVSLRSSF